MSIVVVEELHKRYGDNHAVRGLSLTIDEGEVFAIVGPNGAGKTSTVEILEGHRTRTSGRVEVLGFDPETGGRAYRERIGIVLQEAGMDERFTVRELVSLYAGFYPAPRAVDEVIEVVGLTGKADERTKTLSGGQRRRVDLALGLIGDPELLYLDEPTTGFDPSARRQAWDVVAGLCEIGKTVVLTTHYMEEAYRLADRVAVVAGGQLVALGTPEELVARTSAGRSVLTFLLPAGVSGADLPELEGEVELEDPRVVVRSLSLTADLHTVTGWANARGVELDGLALERGSFEDTYLELIGAGETRG
ncbi:MAG: ABC transporter ATP-binding protein [Nitriliruptor sp.]|nr:MAG: ABC transporter ATP-binding protein [Nitriliruptor sp.]